MPTFERFLSLWVALAILAGVALGALAPGLVEVVAELEIARVNVVVAALIWLMIFPMMLKVEPSCLKEVGRRPKGLALTLVVNWLIKPFTMAALGALFFRHVFAGLVPAADAEQYIAGMILLGVAPCTAMVFVWSHLTDGDAAYTLVQVSVNDLILVFAFAPIAGLLLGVTELEVPWETLVASVVIFVVVPLAAGVLVRTRLLRSERKEAAVEALAAKLKPTSILGLLLTVVLLFAFQAETLIEKPGRVALIAVPLLVQSYGIFALAYGLARVLKLPHAIAAPAAMIGTSNFFELAVAVAISLFGLSSGAALATVVGVLIEVPVMLSLVRFANRTRGWFPPAEGAPPAAESPA
ncbi:MAG TPA: ACR3 family arsenite efflux transporter [Polyangiaceae bacterium LLY-WYZ-15_(1-7)]|nr:arsenical-resistance protein [Myxococcales bacterium]MAT27287.1 arsenical-resistance protein [Sandaracinus sp.]HJL04700.1 ACR3 family arsenite efflux transporter [Polyangiaceae bacterium LLY-WYZ-15_(1-7)]MBJ69938.1 arsenical-resistance protein [Sandaracinus sp.]HJL09735.1 ACR3 family arsenite efflux transporter [Polyangiaceae bacterium LLY-WYZ-15_(1-7)]